MFETLKRLYGDGRIDNAELARAVAMGWITEEQKGEIENAEN